MKLTLLFVVGISFLVLAGAIQPTSFFDKIKDFNTKWLTPKTSYSANDLIKEVETRAPPTQKQFDEAIEALRKFLHPPIKLHIISPVPIPINDSNPFPDPFGGVI